jgi:hypothetical protein
MHTTTLYTIMIDVGAYRAEHCIQGPPDGLEEVPCKSVWLPQSSITSDSGHGTCLHTVVSLFVS